MKDSDIKGVILSHDRVRCPECRALNYLWQSPDDDPEKGSWKCLTPKCTRRWPFRSIILRKRQGTILKGSTVQTLTQIKEGPLYVSKGARGQVVGFSSSRFSEILFLTINFQGFMVQIPPTYVELVS